MKEKAVFAVNIGFYAVFTKPRGGGIISFDRNRNKINDFFKS